MALLVAFVVGPVVTALSVGVMVSLVVNLISIRRLRPGAPSSGAKVSVLVPARDEAATIRQCLESLVAQDHREIELIVLDDRSDDDTAAIARSFSQRGVRVIDGEPLPGGWTGKNWACEQLARAASGEVLCFIDADTTLEPQAVRAAAGLLESEGAGLVTLLLRAERRTFAQATLLPIVNYALLSLFPVWLMHQRRAPRVALGLGPFMIVSRSAYEEVGGHAAAPGEIVDDVRLSRAIKGAGYPVRLANGTALVRTRWYTSVREIWRGFSKNAFGALDSNVPLALAAALILVPLLCAPFLRIPLGLIAGSVPVEAVVQASLILGARAITSIVGRDTLWAVLLHPFALVVWGATLLRSMTLTMTGSTVQWRGREVTVRSRDE